MFIKMQILDGSMLSEKIISSLKPFFSQNKSKLSTILIGDNPSSEVYIKIKRKKSEDLGIDFELIRFEKNAKEEEILNEIKRLNSNNNVNGILVQLPLPPHLDSRKILDSINPEKDVDGLTSYNLGLLMSGKEKIVSCTAKGVIRLLENYNINLEGKNIVIINHSFLVGRPLAELFLNRGATVTICHSKTENIQEHTKNADILVSAVGIPNFINKSMIKDNSVLIDVGITKLETKIVGDIDFEDVKDKCSYLTPVPGGIGPMTVAMLLENLKLIQENQGI